MKKEKVGEGSQSALMALWFVISDEVERRSMGLEILGGKERGGREAHPYILLTNAYAVRKPTVPVNKPYTAQARRL